MGNSLLDIIVFGRNAGKSVGKIYKDVEVKELTLDHVKAFDAELKDAGIEAKKLSPQLLPNYTKQPNI